MNKTVLLRAVFALTVSVLLCAVPEGAFAQRGAHGGFGGFHGGGPGGFHGGTFSGFHGGSFGGFRGGFGFHGPAFGGFHGGFGWRGWGYPRFAWGWGINIGFGFPYWGWGYPYSWYWWGPYASAAPSIYPCYGSDPQRDPCDYRYSDTCDDGGPDRPNSPKQNGSNAPAKPSNTPSLKNSRQPDYRTSLTEDYRLAMHVSDAAKNGPEYDFANLETLEPPSELRPAVRNAVQALRAMPSDARERQLASGRYANFSSQEKELLRNLVQAQREQ